MSPPRTGSTLADSRNPLGSVRRVAVLSLVLSSVSALSGCYTAQIEQQQQQHNARLCGDQRYAWESGHNAGVRRDQMSTRWADYCSPQVRDQAMQAYWEGYQQGLQYAPQSQIIIGNNPNGGYYPRPAPGQAPMATQPAQPAGVRAPVGTACRFSSDCGQGMSCRRDDGGAEVCMGFGSPGDTCMWNSDCLSGSCDSNDGYHGCR